MHPVARVSIIFTWDYYTYTGEGGSVVVEVLNYKPEGRGF
jgi:hypothetical protein